MCRRRERNETSFMHVTEQLLLQSFIYLFIYFVFVANLDVFLHQNINPMPMVNQIKAIATIVNHLSCKLPWLHCSTHLSNTETLCLLNEFSTNFICQYQFIYL